MRALKAYLVDDERRALEMLEMMLLEIGGIEIVGRSGNPFEALEQIRDLKPDAVFLDIEMPGMGGIELAERLRSDVAALTIVFVTAYDKFAIGAFEQGAIDYLLKPLEEARLLKTVERIRRSTRLDAAGGTGPDEQAPPSLNIRLLGGLEVSDELQGARIWRTAKPRELFVFLLLHSAGGVHRDDIIDRLWGDVDYAKAKIYLHTCISYLRADFRKLGFANIVEYKEEKYMLSREGVDCDYFSLRQSLLAARALLEGGEAGKLEAALELYRGPLLQRCDYPWAIEAIEQLRRLWLDVSLLLAEHYRSEGMPSKAAAVAERLLLEEPYDETVYRLLMECYRTMGKHDQAARIRDRLIHALQELQHDPYAQSIEFHKAGSRPFPLH
ncbi:response regulator [Paenibacillus hemerocallicola]|nr:response regulator [Paenibacillus hemerocallicola]